MICTCRTKSLRIFVQSLTELRITDPAITRPARFCRLAASPVTFRPAPAYFHARLFSSASTIYAPVGDEGENTKNPTTGRAEEEPSYASINITGEISNNESPLPIPLGPGSGLHVAKQNGAILDLSDESINKLITDLKYQTPTAEQIAIPEEHDVVDSMVQSESRPRPKTTVKSGQLKRLKIIKEKPQPQPDVEDLHDSEKEEWQVQKQALKEKFPEGWRPRKRLSPDALDGIRALHSQFPEQYTTEVLAKHFEVSPEAIRRILKSKWVPSPEEEVRRQERWFNRGKNIWSQMAELGKKPPRRWRREGIVRKPHWNEKKGPRTQYPYVPRHRQVEEKVSADSVQRKLSGTIL